MNWAASVKDLGPDRRPGADRVARKAFIVTLCLNLVETVWAVSVDKVY